jgi:ABC-type multidrug transport system fused ATPase/permease subunit
MFKPRNLTLFLSSPDIKRRFIILQFLFLFSSIFEVGGISLIGPLIYFTSEASEAMQNEYFIYIYELLNLQSYESFLLLYSALTIFIIILGGAASFLSVIYLSKIATSSGINLSTQVLQRYLNLKWKEHIAIDKSKMINEIYQETVRVTQNIFLPILMINKSLFLSLILVSFLFIVSWQSAVSLFIALTAIYLMLFLILKRSLNANSKILTDAHENRYKFLNDTFESMKQIHIWGNEKICKDGFEDASNEWGNALRRNMNISLLPRYVVETLILICVAIGVGVFFYNPGENFSQNIPSISIFIFSAFKLLPAIQQIYAFISTITGNIYSLNNLADLLANEGQPEIETQISQDFLPLQTLDMKNISFHYPDSDFTLRDINLSFTKGEIIGITGYSGSGKSTFVDLLMGLIPPDHGTIIFNGREVSVYENKSWFKKLSYLPPKIHLINESIERNIHFSETSEINSSKIERILNEVNLNGVLDDHKTTKNVNFSSGQIQRLGIARSIYKDHEIIFYDEPTSALDNKNRDHFIARMQRDKDEVLTILISHDLSLLQAADKVLVFDNGKIEFFGSYDDALQESDIMATLRV